MKRRTITAIIIGILAEMLLVLGSIPNQALVHWAASAGFFAAIIAFTLSLRSNWLASPRIRPSDVMLDIFCVIFLLCSAGLVSMTRLAAGLLAVSFYLLAVRSHRLISRSKGLSKRRAIARFNANALPVPLLGIASLIGFLMPGAATDAIIAITIILASILHLGRRA